MEFKDFVEVFQPVEMESTLIKLLDELQEYPKSFISRVNARVLELKFGKENRYSIVSSIFIEGDVYVVNLKGVIYIAGSMIDSRNMIEFDEHQFPAIAITQVWKN
jgi:hypothetical protein